MPITLAEYLRTSYRPDLEYRDGELVDRNVGEQAHGLMQVALGTYIGTRRKQWQVAAYFSLRVRARENWYPIPDVCVYPLPAPEERFPYSMPLLWIEILSQEDRMLAMLHKAADLVACGAPNVWIVNPFTLESFLSTPAGGPNHVPSKTLAIPGTPIVIPLLDVMEE